MKDRITQGEVLIAIGLLLILLGSCCVVYAAFVAWGLAGGLFCAGGLLGILGAMSCAIGEKL